MSPQLTHKSYIPPFDTPEISTLKMSNDMKPMSCITLEDVREVIVTFISPYGLQRQSNKGNLSSNA